MHEVYLCLDVGGTEIKAAPLDANGKMLSKIQYFPAMACADKKTLLEHFAHIFASICPADKVPIEIDLAFPGPFDYENGICLLQGLEKYDALYGCNLRHAFAALSGLPQKRIQFINDAAAFALGELTFGSSRQAHKTLFTVIGTGCGSAFGVDGFLAAKGTLGVPPHGYFYSAPFMDSCVDDYISRRGLEKLTKDLLGTPLDGRALAARVAASDTQAASCFLQFGVLLRDALSPQIEAFNPDMICLGGQIMRSALLFLSPLEALCNEKNVKLSVTQDTSMRTMQGLTCANSRYNVDR